ncbi:MAG: FAD-dependent oxidoreductase, partial [Pseudomonadota bacterium]
MADLRTIEVPDIGDFSDVEIIELLVAEGDQVEADQSLLTVESDKASMDIPAPFAGTITSLQIKVGDKISAGSVIGVLETSESTSAPPAPAPAASPATETTTQTSADTRCQLLVIGAGPGGYSAAFRAADLGVETVLLERNDTLGGVCLNVGCIPSKALLHIAAVIDETAHLGAAGVRFAAPEVDLDGLRDYKNSVVGKLTGGLAGMAKQRKVTVVNGSGVFNGEKSVAVTGADGSQTTIAFDYCIIAAGSESVNLPFLPDDPRIVDSTGALELPSIPERMLVIGGGIIGLELGSVYATLGAEVDIVEMTSSLMPGADADLVKVWQKHNTPRFNRVMLDTRTSAAVAKEDGIHVSFDGAKAPDVDVVYDFVLQAVGRKPNGALLAVEQAALTPTDRGFLDVDGQMRTAQRHIFAIGDIVGQPMLAH